MYRVKHKTPVKGLSAQPGSSLIISYSDHAMYSWIVHKFVAELISLGCTIKKLAHSTHPMVPRSIVATTDDAVVRLVSPVNCHVITTALLPITSSVVSIATGAHSSMFSPPTPSKLHTCSHLTETLYILLDDGNIHVMDCSTNPCTLKDTWNTRLYGTIILYYVVNVNTIAIYSCCLLDIFIIGLCSCVAMYESVLSQEEVEDVLKEDRWLAVKLLYEKELQERYPHRKSSRNVFEGKVLLMAGSCTGQLMVIDQELGGTVICNVQAHENRITLIACNPKADQVISVGEGITFY